MGFKEYLEERLNEMAFSSKDINWDDAKSISDQDEIPTNKLEKIIDERIKKGEVEKKITKEGRTIIINNLISFNDLFDYKERLQVGSDDYEELNDRIENISENLSKKYQEMGWTKFYISVHIGNIFAVLVK